MSDRKKVLIVDPSSYFRRTLVDVIQMDGAPVEVDEAETAAQALDIINQRQQDVCFLDLSLPRSDGLALIAAIRRRMPAAHIVVLTSHDSVEYQKASIDNGADYFLSKEKYLYL